MATYRCLQSGNTVTFTHQVDIDSMRGHSGYERLDDIEQAEPEIKPLPLLAPTKTVGRPRKVAIT